MPCASFSMLDGPGGTGSRPPSIKNDAHGIEKLLLKTQVSLTSFLQSEVKIIHIIVQNITYQCILFLTIKHFKMVYSRSSMKLMKGGITEEVVRISRFANHSIHLYLCKLSTYLSTYFSRFKCPMRSGVVQTALLLMSISVRKGRKVALGLLFV